MTTEPVYFPDDPFGPCKPVTSYTELIEVIRDQVGRLSVRYEDFDTLAGFPAGLTGKAFGPAQVKRLGPEKLFDALRGAGLRLSVEIDPEQVEKMRKRIADDFLPRQSNQARMGNEASPAGTRMMGRVFRHFAKLGGRARMAKMTPKERSAHQRMAALAKAKKDRKARREAQKSAERWDRYHRRQAAIAEKCGTVAP